MNKDPIRTQNAKKVLIKDQVLKIWTLLEAVHLWKVAAKQNVGSSPSSAVIPKFQEFSEIG